jgi:hypothetical protein
MATVPGRIFVPSPKLPGLVLMVTFKLMVFDLVEKNKIKRVSLNNFRAKKPIPQKKKTAIP